MPLSEFGLIARYFKQKNFHNSASYLGVGDDCALLDIPEGYQLALTVDTMVENVHFFAGEDPESVGHKLLAVNLSDLAAMGAKPIAVTLAITLPEVDQSWLQAFSLGFMQLAAQYKVDLIGGDTTSGPLAMTVQAMGLIPKNQALTRATANPGDLIYVSGALGDAGLGLKIKQGYFCKEPEMPLLQFNRPEPRIETGLHLRGIATACIDLSDGLLADLGHILDSSHVGACLDWEKLPFSQAVREYINKTGDWKMPLVTGEDYELCFTVPLEKQHLLHEDCKQIGVIESELGLRMLKSGGKQTIEAKGFDHFS
jgi:thiamine-monophosphate kinase